MWELHVVLHEYIECQLTSNGCRLEPMLGRIAESRTAVLCPEIDIIDAQRLSYHGVGGGSVGGFWWSLHFSWRPMPRREMERRSSNIDPIRYWCRQTLTTMPNMVTIPEWWQLADFSSFWFWLYNSYRCFATNNCQHKKRVYYTITVSNALLYVPGSYCTNTFIYTPQCAHVGWHDDSKILLENAIKPLWKPAKHDQCWAFISVCWQFMQ